MKVPQGANHDLVYVYSDDQGHTWRTSSGDIVDGPARVDTPGVTAVGIPRWLGLMNTHGQAVDSRGRVHVVMWHCTEESLAAAGSAPWEQRWGPAAARRYVHYWRDLEGVWHQSVLPSVAGNRSKLFSDRKDNLLLIFRDGEQQARSKQLLLEGNPKGNLVIMAASAASGWSDWRIVHTEPGPFVNEMLGDTTRWAQEGGPIGDGPDGTG